MVTQGIARTTTAGIIMESEKQRIDTLVQETIKDISETHAMKMLINYSMKPNALSTRLSQPITMTNLMTSSTTSHTNKDAISIEKDNIE